MARNTNRQGANFELAVMADLEARGYTCLRSSGSRGAVDVVAISDAGTRDRLLFIQCKITDPLIPPSERAELQRLASCAGATPAVAHKVSEGRSRVIRYRSLTGLGPKEWSLWTPPTKIEKTEE